MTYALQILHVHDDGTVTTYSWRICRHQFKGLLDSARKALGKPREALITGGHAESVTVPE